MRFRAFKEFFYSNILILSSGVEYDCWGGESLNVGLIDEEVFGRIFIIIVGVGGIIIWLGK